jgi:hypothetical protein
MQKGGAPQDDAAVTREWALRAVLGMVLESGGTTVTRSIFRSRPEVDMTVRDASPVAGLRAARRLQLAAEGLTRGYIQQAREDGHTWHEIGTALGLPRSEADQETSLPQAAYNHAMGDSQSDHSWSSQRAFTWTCTDCRNVISDHGPEAGHPEDAESGHASQCRRLAAAIAEWNALWDAEAGQ